MTILFLSRLFYPHIGGVEKHVEKVSEELIKLGHHITIVTEQFDQKLKQEEIHKDIKIYRIPVANVSEKQKKWRIWRWLWQHRHLIKSADLIHAHDVAYWFFPLKAVFPTKPFFITYHGYEGVNPPSLLAIIQRKTGELISNGTINVGDFMQKWYHVKPTFVTYGANDPPKVNSASPPEPKAVYLGRLSQDTGILIYLKAINLIKNKGITLPLEVYGSGSQEHQAKAFTKLHHLPVTFHGVIPNASAKLSSFKFAFVSRYLSIIEAMQAKSLVFAVYNNQIKKDYLACHPQTHSMFISHNAQTLANQIQNALKKPDKFNQSIESAYTWARKQTWKKLTLEYQNLWTQKKSQ